MTMPEADIDYPKVEEAKVGELVYSKTSFFGKPKWIIKDKEGNKYVFENYDVGLLAELILKTLQEKRSVGA